MMNAEQPERFHPVILHSILVALRRFEPDFYSHICRSYHLDADTILGLFSSVEEIGPGPLGNILKELRQHHAAHEILHLAGRNALVELAQQARQRLDTRRGGEARFRQLLKPYLTPLLGRSAFNVLSRGELTFVEIRDSVFARGIEAVHPVCGFYTGVLLELAQSCSAKSCVCAEVRCHAMDPEVASCMFQVGF